jgi:hypothetical protein
MIRAGKRLFCLGFCGVFSVAAADTPYQPIIDRNVFALKAPPPPAVVNPEANKPPPPNITLTGITTILNSKRAFISVQMPAKPPEPAKVQSFMLREGERDGEIEILEIDEKAGMVKVNEFGTITNLTWEKNGLKMASGGSAPTPSTGPGLVSPPPGNPFNPGAAGFNKAIPSRTLRLPGVPNAPGASPGGTANPYQGSAAGGVSPAFAAAQPASAAPQQQEQPPLSMEAQELLIEAQREAAKQQGHPMATILPPTRISQGLYDDGSGGTPKPNPSGPQLPPRAPGLPQLPQ